MVETFLPTTSVENVGLNGAEGIEGPRRISRSEDTWRGPIYAWRKISVENNGVGGGVEGEEKGEMNLHCAGGVAAACRIPGIRCIPGTRRTPHGSVKHQTNHQLKSVT